MRMTTAVFVSLALVFQVSAENDFAQATKTKSIRLITTAKEGGDNWKYMESPKRATNWTGSTFNDKTWQLEDGKPVGEPRKDVAYSDHDDAGAYGRTLGSVTASRHDYVRGPVGPVRQYAQGGSAVHEERHAMT